MKKLDIISTSIRVDLLSWLYSLLSGLNFKTGLQICTFNKRLVKLLMVSYEHKFNFLAFWPAEAIPPFDRQFGAIFFLEGGGVLKHKCETKMTFRTAVNFPFEELWGILEWADGKPLKDVHRRKSKAYFYNRHTN